MPIPTPQSIQDALTSNQQVNSFTLAQAPASQHDQERKRKMLYAWRAYRGEFPQPLKIAKDQPNDNVISNRCKPIVDKGVSFLFGQVVKIEAPGETFSADNDSTDKDSPIQDFIEGLWGDDDQKMTLLSLLATNGGVCGQAFFKLVPAQGRMKYPRIIVLDPLLIRIVTSPEDCSLVLAYIIEYPTNSTVQKKQIIARVDPDGLAGVAGEYDVDDYWTITDYAKNANAGSWYKLSDPITWDYPFPPIFTCPNLPNPNESWGTSDLTPDLIAQNEVLNFVESNIARILKYHAHPKTYIKGVSKAQIDMSVDDVIILPSKESEIGNLEMHSDLQSSLKYTAEIRADMDEQSRVPAVALGRRELSPSGTLSGVALQLLFQPLLEKTTLKQRLYGSLIREITRAALICAGLLQVEDFEDYPIELHWQDLLPMDDLAAAQTATALQALGVSQATILQRLGFNPDDEAAKVDIETAKKVAKQKALAPPAPPAPQPVQLAPVQVVQSTIQPNDSNQQDSTGTDTVQQQPTK